MVSFLSAQHGVEVPALPDVMELLGELTADADGFSEIPRLLVSILPVERAALSVLRRTSDDDVVLLSASFAAGQMAPHRAVPSAGMPARAEEQTPGQPAPIPAAATPAPTPAALPEVPAGGGLPPLTFVRELDARHRLVLVLQEERHLPELVAQFAPFAEALCEALVRSIRTFLAWYETPALLGGPFSDITAAQWRVLCQLGSDLSEKQLANSMEISPHTLHCHIKSIYQKLDVRSRLGALRILRQAVRQFRIRAHQWPRASNPALPSPWPLPLPSGAAEPGLPQPRWHRRPRPAANPAATRETVWV